MSLSAIERKYSTIQGDQLDMVNLDQTASDFKRGTSAFAWKSAEKELKQVKGDVQRGL